MARLQHAVRGNLPDEYRAFAESINEQSERLLTIRGLMAFKFADTPISLDEVEPAAEIVKRQDGFFRRGVAELKPLTLWAVAEAIELHESTVSRVTSNKYLACPRGTYELKYFFTSGVATADGEGSASAVAVKAAIRSLIEAEDPRAVVSDDALVDLLNAKGFDLARRTVAKYREAMGIGSSVQRRRQKRLAGVG